MRLMSLGTAHGPTLVGEAGGRCTAIGGHRDVGDLLRAHPGRSLVEAAEVAGWSYEVEGQPLLPVRPDEVWACGVTYERSRDARVAESVVHDVYSRVYDAERPELFFKATGARVTAPGGAVGLRSDSLWQVPEPELALVLSAGVVVGLTIGNDMSCRDIEGDNPLYLPQAKTYAGSCSLGPAVVPVELVDPYDLTIELRVERAGAVVVEQATSTSRLHTTLDRLVDHLRRDNPLPPVTVLFTGTGIVPPDGFSLEPGDVVRIAVPGIGELVNPCVAAAEVPVPTGWTLHREEVPA